MRISRAALILITLVTAAIVQRSPSAFAAAPARSTLNEVAWLQQYVDQGFIQYEVARHQPLSNGAVNCNSNGSAASFTNISCQRYTFYSAAYGVVLGPTNATDGRDYIHHALSMMTYAISPHQDQSTGAYFIPASCGSSPVDLCTAQDMTFAYADFAHSLALLGQSPFYQQDDTADHAIVSGTVAPSMSKGLGWLNLSATGQAYRDLLNDYTATNRMITHGGAYYLTALATASYNSSIASTGTSYGTHLLEEALGTSHYIKLPASPYGCVPASLCPWPTGSAFWTENEDRNGSISGFDSGYGGVALFQGDFFAMHAAPSADVTTLNTDLQGYSTWELGRVVRSTGMISEEGNYRTCGHPAPPTDTANCTYKSASGGIAIDSDINMNWENVAWSLYYEAPFAPDAAGKTCSDYISAARAIEYYNFPLSTYIPLNQKAYYPAVQASGYNIPAPSAAAPAACSSTYAALRQSVLGDSSRAKGFSDPRSAYGGGVRLSRGDSIVFPAIDATLRYKSKDIAIVYALSGLRPQAVTLRINGGRPVTVLLVPTYVNSLDRKFGTADVPAVNLVLGRLNKVSIEAEAGQAVEIMSVTPRRDLSAMRAR